MCEHALREIDGCDLTTRAELADAALRLRDLASAELEQQRPEG